MRITHLGEALGLPTHGVAGEDALVQATLLRYAERLPVRKAAEALGRTYGLSMTPATVLDMTDRVAGWLRPEYEGILGRIRAADVVYVDETGVNVDGVRHWIWVFTTGREILFAVRKSRGEKVLREVLGEGFGGVVVCDGGRSYPDYTERLQRCWAHLLREARCLAEHVEEAVALSEGLYALYRCVSVPSGDRPPPGLVGEARAGVLRLVGGPFGSE